MPLFPFIDMKNFILGSKYDLSVALLPSAQMREAMVYKKSKESDPQALASNVLAFPLSKSSGEILLCPATARVQAKNFSMSPNVFVAYLFIHGLLHLKGLIHGATMEREERRIMIRFDLRADE